MQKVLWWIFTEIDKAGNNNQIFWKALLRQKYQFSLYNSKFSTALFWKVFHSFLQLCFEQLWTFILNFQTSSWTPSSNIDNTEVFHRLVMAVMEFFFFMAACMVLCFWICDWSRVDNKQVLGYWWAVLAHHQGLFSPALSPSKAVGWQ